MGIFSGLFTSSDSHSNSNSELDWVALVTIEQIEEIKTISRSKKVLIFKHSTRCGVSSMVLKQFEQKSRPEEKTALYFLDLLRYREISDAVAERFNVPHQSPQLLVIENGVCASHASHYGIVEMVKG